MSPAPDRATGGEFAGSFDFTILQNQLSAKSPCSVVWSPEFEDISPANSDGAVAHHEDDPNGISDVLAAIELADGGGRNRACAGAAAIGAEVQTSARADPSSSDAPFVRIVEQPASVRFRYQCESRTAGSIPGASSPDGKPTTFPEIEICNYVGKAIVFVSCVTKDEPYRPHSHNLVGREHCQRGVCIRRVHLTSQDRRVTFNNLGIQCVRRRDIKKALLARQEMRVDPFLTGFEHRHQPQNMDLTALRLCFQVFLPGAEGQSRRSLEPVVSEVIHDKKGGHNLKIRRISRPSGSAAGGTEVILLCDKVQREDIAVVLSEEREDTDEDWDDEICGAAWESSASVVIVHKQVAIAFTTPPYRDPHCSKHVDVFIQLLRPSDGARSVGVPFTFIPEQPGMDMLKRKRRKMLNTLLIEQFEKEMDLWDPQHQQPNKLPTSGMTLNHNASLQRVMFKKPPDHFAMQKVEEMDMPGPSHSIDPHCNPQRLMHSSQMPSSSGFHLQTTNVTNVSSNQHVTQRKAMSLEKQVMSSRMYEVSSGTNHEKTTSLHVLSPQSHVTPRQNPVMSPQEQAIVLQSQMYHQTYFSPQSMSPGVTSPQEQMFHAIMSPQNQLLAHPHDAMSPQTHVMYPQRAASPEEQAMTELQPSHTHQLDQYDMELQIAETANSSSSLTNLLLTADAELTSLQLNSDEIRQLASSLS